MCFQINNFKIWVFCENFEKVSKFFPSFSYDRKLKLCRNTLEYANIKLSKLQLQAFKFRIKFEFSKSLFMVFDFRKSAKMLLIFFWSSSYDRNLKLCRNTHKYANIMLWKFQVPTFRFRLKFWISKVATRGIINSDFETQILAFSSTSQCRYINSRFFWKL